MRWKYRFAYTHCTQYSSARPECLISASSATTGITNVDRMFLGFEQNAETERDINLGIKVAP
jgi:hypothetical protein